MKPNVIFFGDNVPMERVAEVRRRVEQCDRLLVVGSSLYVFSGYRFVVQARELGKKIAILNIGQTRADHLVNLKINAKAGEVLSKVEIN